MSDVAKIAAGLGPAGREALDACAVHPTTPWANALLIGAGLLSWRKRWWCFGPFVLRRTRLGDAVRAHFLSEQSND